MIAAQVANTLASLQCGLFAIAGLSHLRAIRGVSIQTVLSVQRTSLSHGKELQNEMVAALSQPQAAMDKRACEFPVQETVTCATGTLR